MGRKLNPEYRERMRERRNLPVCYCGKRTKQGTHKVCVSWVGKGESKSYTELVAMRAPLWLLSRKLMDEQPELDYEKRWDKIFDDICTRTQKREPMQIDESELPDWLKDLPNN